VTLVIRFGTSTPMLSAGNAYCRCFHVHSTASTIPIGTRVAHYYVTRSHQAR
jgi:hypothetical protein